ncbi:MAG: 30S ribosomal protein S2 [Candidatus Aenigmarchaeota archaeon]|nr:30S ribosomal protein S2 [Candidatus Aenigmarchaeota archaeon]
MPGKLLVPREKYLTAGVHIGMTAHTADMKRFIYKVRPNGLAVLNVGMLDKRIAFTANFLSDKKSILIVSRKDNGHAAAKKFSEVIGGRSIVKRFMPGSLTNPTYKNFFEPDVIIVTDPAVDKQAIKEAVQMRIPIIGMADTFNQTSYIDIILPCNNKGKKSLALIFWLMAKLIKEKRGEEFKLHPEDFGYE